MWRKLLKYIEKSGNILAIKQLAYSILEPQWSAKTFSLIHHVAENGYADLMDLMLKFCKNKDFILDFGWQPLPMYFALNYAAKDGHLEVLEVRLSKNYAHYHFVDFISFHRFS